MQLKFKPVELQCFNWIHNVAPCFPVNSSKINVISDPKKFYDTLCQRFHGAKHRISMASLYIGTGKMEKHLLQGTKDNIIQNKSLRLNVLLDYQRGTRGKVNCITLLKDFYDTLSDQCKISLYQTPRLYGSWSKALPSRYNEIVGLQHMKIYIADDSVLLSGANCSNDYFQQRQDRYIEIEDAELAKFYSELIDEVSNYSKTCLKDKIQTKKYESKESMIKEVSKNVSNFMERWRTQQLTKLSAQSDNDDSTTDTWIFPLIQMGEFNITQDEGVTSEVLATAPKGSHISLATGYFNLTDNYAKTLLSCKSNISLLMAHPNANGFLGAPGPAGGIPHAYSLIATKFWQRVVELNQTSRVQMLEYERPGWTFHAKGLWYYPPGSGVPWATIVGSANLGERSVRRDLEAQAAIFTASPDLQARLQQEASLLHEHATECSLELQKRETPLWVRAIVGLFRTYF